MTLATLILFFSINGCASTQMELTAGTLSNGHKYPLCIEVTQKVPLGGVTLLAAFCANAQTEVDAKAAEYRALYPNATIAAVKPQ